MALKAKSSGTAWLADPQANGYGPGRLGGVAESDRSRLDELLWQFNRVEMYSLLERINTYLMRWARKKYKRLRTWKRFKAWWRGVTEREPELFAHWAWMRAYRWRG